MKSMVFAGRVGKEIRRDPLSYIFCLGFPIVMLVIMSVVDSSIPAQANMTVFHINNLAPGIAYFGLTFVMLFTGIQVSKDRTTALLLRLYASPMKAADYVIGYTLPVCILGIAQIPLPVGFRHGKTLRLRAEQRAAAVIDQQLVFSLSRGIEQDLLHLIQEQVRANDWSRHNRKWHAHIRRS